MRSVPLLSKLIWGGFVTRRKPERERGKTGGGEGREGGGVLSERKALENMREGEVSAAGRETGEKESLKYV